MYFQTDQIDASNALNILRSDLLQHRSDSVQGTHYIVNDDIMLSRTKIKIEDDKSGGTLIV